MTALKLCQEVATERTSEDQVERVARAIYAECEAMAVEDGCQDQLPGWDGEEEDGRQFARRLAARLIACLRSDDKLREALERLGSMEAFAIPRRVDPEMDEELLARIDYARAALASDQSLPATYLQSAVPLSSTL